ncbi:MAG: ROK family protein, partial [Armatimonadetes bacterium]|nr:ROK family protein [Armatimonadota bacterium]
MAAQQRVLALDISGSRARLAVIDAGGELGRRAEVPNRGGQAQSYWPAVRAAAEDLAHGLAAVGISFGGPVDRAGQILSIHVDGWSGIDPAAELGAQLGVPAVIENDANCGAVGEARFGRWGAVDSLVFLTCSTGIGGGIYSAGHLLRGARGLAGELGHLCVDPNGLSCPCGSRGCLEAMCSGTAIARRATAALSAS